MVVVSAAAAAAVVVAFLSELSPAPLIFALVRNVRMHAHRPPL